jgi:hypothetical protein
MSPGQADQAKKRREMEISKISPCTGPHVCVHGKEVGVRAGLQEGCWRVAMNMKNVCMGAGEERG